MENIKTGFIKPNREVVLLEYYKLESWCKSEIEKYITEDKSKLKSRLEQFRQFASEYTYFKPYLDFVIFKMKYIQINPFFMKETLGYAEGNQYFLKKNCDNYKEFLNNGAFYFNRATDKNYNIQKGNVVENGMIDVKGNVIELFSDGDVDLNAWGHPGLSCMILNQYCSFSKALCEDFQMYVMEGHFNIYTMYLMERLGFAQVTKRRSHRFIYLKSSILTQTQVNIAYFIKEYYGHELLPYGVKSDESSKEKQLIKQIWGDVYENR